MGISHRAKVPCRNQRGPKPIGRVGVAIWTGLTRAKKTEGNQRGNQRGKKKKRKRRGSRKSLRSKSKMRNDSQVAAA